MVYKTQGEKTHQRIPNGKQEWTIQKHWQHRVHKAKRHVREYRRIKQEWTIQRHWQHRVYKTQGEKTHQRIPKGKTRMDNPEKLAAQGIQDTMRKDTFENTEG